MAERKAIMLYRDYGYFFDALSDEEAGILIKALFHYDEFGSDDPLLENLEEQPLASYYTFMKKRIDADKKAYEAVCKKNAENVRARWNKEKDSS